MSIDVDDYFERKRNEGRMTDEEQLAYDQEQEARRRIRAAYATVGGDLGGRAAHSLLRIIALVTWLISALKNAGTTLYYLTILALTLGTASVMIIFLYMVATR